MKRLDTSKNKKSSNDSINKSEYQINRGIELIISGGKRKQAKPFHMVLQKMVCFFNREVTIYFEFSLNSRKIPR